VNLPIGFGANRGERGEKAFGIEVIAKERRPAVTTIHDVLQRSGVFERTARGQENDCDSD